MFNPQTEDQIECVGWKHASPLYGSVFSEQKTAINTCGMAFSTFLECSQISGVFCHSIMHGLGFFICYMI